MQGRGELAIILLVVSLASGVAQLGLSQAFVVSVRAGDWSQVHTTSRLAWSGVVVAVGAGGLAAVMGSIAETVQTTYYWLTVTLASLTSLLLFATNVAMASATLITYNLLRTAPSLMIVFLVFVIWRTQGLAVPSVLIVQGACTAAVLVLGFASIVRLIDRVRRDAPPRGRVQHSSWRTYLTLGASYHGTALLGMLVNNFDKLALTVIGGAYQMGLYAAAYGLSRAVPALQNSLGAVIFAKLAGTGSDDVKATTRTLKVFRLTFMPTLLCAALLALLSPQVIRLVLGDRFGAAALPFGILCFEAAIGGASWLLAQQLNAQGRPGLVLARQAASMAPLLGMVWFIPADGAAVVLSILMLLSAVIRLWVTIAFFKKYLGVPRVSAIPSGAEMMQAIHSIVRWGRHRGA